MKALVLAGGTGTRLRPFSYSMPKQLIPIANRPVLLHCLDNIKDAGVTEVGIIVGDRSDEIRAIVGDGSALGLRITYIPQERPLGLAHTVTVAAGFLGDDDFLMYLGDNMLLGGLRDQADRFRTRRPAAQVVTVKVPDPSAFGVVELDADGRVSRLVEKPKEPRSDLALIGVYFFTPAVHEAVAAIEPSARGELEITDALQWLLEQGHTVDAERYHGYWKDTGRFEDVLECNREYLDGLTPRVQGEVDDASVLVGPVVIEPGAQVVRSQLTGPLIVGAGSVVSDSRIGPHTSVGRDCLLAGAGLEYSIALDGVSVRGVHGIHGSLIGRAANVTSAGFDGVDSIRHRLVIGDHTSVEVAA
ncbi:glucose-1-phosphate thymidylyltransferase [Streptomyces sp. SID8379]|uniref:glucose-1-phosphate thymidylyltransferase n=1 Tax=unclassified Streptomyces TaxID=2593676 RepID=UPI000372182A|nr:MULTISPECIES: glucose-1-phosphate thymidylyltransferase [unclassified Streptomyces]MYW65862.1 glucose-1-phosphate thymidylyltransferase [Streptomyces sp. SID8379]